LVAEVDETREDARRNTRGRFEQWAKNPVCEANTLSAVHNVRMDKAAESIGLEPSFGQSPFAIARGNTFEAGLFYNNAERLRTALERRGCLPAGSSGFLDLRLKMNGGSTVTTVDGALAQTVTWLQRVASKPDDGASIVAAPMVKIPRGVILPEALLIIDAMTVTVVGGAPMLTVGEIKVFPDRGGHTDAGQLAAARAQAGLYRRAVEMSLGSLGLSAQIAVNARGFLVFTWPGSNQPSIRANEDLDFQAIRAERGFARLEQVAQQVVRTDDFSADLPELLHRVVEANTTYTDVCLGFCDLSPRCYQRALDLDDPIVLGAEAKRLLGTTTMGRAIELLNGAEPGNEREADLQRQLQVS
jgi:hypothetical protein